MAERQSIHFNEAYYKYDFIREIDLLWNIFADEDIEENSKDITLHDASKHIISSMEAGLCRNYSYKFAGTPEYIPTANDDNKFVLVCFSGGKDSLATVLYYLSHGYDVRLYTVRGINRGYPDEYKAAVRVAENLHLPIFVEEIKLSGKKYYIEHPLKNQVIACAAIAYCIENKLPANLAFGNYIEDVYAKCIWGVNWTDAYPLWECFNAFISCFVEGAKVNIPFYSEEKAFKVLNDNFELIPLSQSCLMTIRNREQLRRHNSKKYGVDLLEHRCGSCWKCCYEYVYFCDVGKFEYNEGFYEHCLEVLRKRCAEWFGNERKFSDLIEVHDAYFPKLVSRYKKDGIVSPNEANCSTGKASVGGAAEYVSDSYQSAEHKEKHTICFNGKTFETTFYQELTQEQYERLRDEHYQKPAFELVQQQFIDVANGKQNTGLITKYYMQDLKEKVRKRKSKFSVEEVFASRELVGFLVGKVMSNPKVYNNPSLVKNIETVCRIGGSGCVWASASNFPMKTIDMILSKYNRNNIIYDFSCGWGNRMLACVRSGIKYLGTDPNYILIDRLKQMHKDYEQTTGAKSEIDIRASGSEQCISEWKRQVGLAFSSPPYYDEEDYVIGKQSYAPGKTYEEWLNTYLLPTIQNINTYLIDNGVFCINVKNIGKYKLEQDVVRLAEECGFELFAVEKLRNNKRPHKQLGTVDNSEKIYCFKKRLTQGVNNG